MANRAGLREWVFRLWGTLRRSRRDREMEEELRSHLELAGEDLQRRGSTEETLRAARLRFGGTAQAMEAMRDQRGLPWLEDLARDVRHALRALRRSPVFTAVAMLTLALGIGANTAMFSVLNAAMFRPLPYRSPEQLAMLWSELPSQNLREGRSAYWNFEQWRGQTGSFEELAAFDPASITLTSADKAERISVVRTTPNFFPLLGIQPELGRIFSPEEAEQRQRLAVISHRFWRSRFAGSPEAIGATISLDGMPSQIIGILPDTFRFDTDVWQPHTLLPDWDTARAARGGGAWLVVGRLQANVTFEQAQAEMNAIARHLDEQMPAAQQHRGISVVPLTLQVTGSKTRLALWMLTGAVFCLLLIAAGNVASLSLARSAGREREIAIRASLGAGRARIVRQFLTETVTLAVLSGVLGLLVAQAGIRFILAIKPADLARLNEIGLDPRALGWALAICLLTGILVGLAPAITMARRSLMPSAEGGRSISAGVATRGIRRALVVTEFALALILLAGCGLLIRSLWSVENVDPGFRPEQVLSVQLLIPEGRTGAQRTDFYNRVLEQTVSLPGVESAGIIGDLFIGGNAEQILTTEGNAQTTSERMRFRRDEVSDAFFTAVGTPLLKGRFFSFEDGADSPRVAIINDAMARRLWPGRDPLGERFKLGAADSRSPWFTVVGIVGDMRRQGLETEPIPQMFEPLAQNPSRLATLLVRTSIDDPLKLVGVLQNAVHRVEKYAPVYGATTLDIRLGSFLTERRFQSSLLIAFSVVALLMAAIGIYGLMQYSIATRTQEIGIRIAVGAQAGEIFRMIIGEGLKLSLTGLALGLAGALMLSRVSSSLLFGISSTDPVTFVAVSLLLAAVAAAACYFPARRAIKIDPISALRQE